MEIKERIAEDIHTKKKFLSVRIYLTDEDIEMIKSDEDFSDGLGMHHRIGIRTDRAMYVILYGKPENFVTMEKVL